ncbi:MAG: gliding motility-associated C-terminal domain-containing protein [Chitinophagaceae bacterium]|nr:gliding motility-associated C-terminal domain-containing protein [Chitinophagaceae bacterium]
MKMFFTSKIFGVLFYLSLFNGAALSQTCTTPGQTPSTAFPVCGTTTFIQTTVPACSTNDLFVPGCSNGTGGAAYQNKNPFFYKFTCYVSGTLGFRITPSADFEDYDWQLYDITGQNPNAIFTNNSLVVTGNWSGTYGPTGASASGVNYINCASVPTNNEPTFAQMPMLIAGHEYLLMVSHFTDTQSGYSLSFGGGTAVITDPKIPAMISVTPDCNGQVLNLKLNKDIRCNSLSANGSEFSISPSGTTATGATTTICSAGFVFDEVVITLTAPLTSGTHQLVINTGSDGNTLLDVCGNNIAPGQSISFDYFIPQPILADSIGKAPCTPDSILIYYPKKIKCSSISPTGSDFSISGPTPVTIISASGNCINDESKYIVLKLGSTIYTKGLYTVSIQPGIDGSPIFDVCGQPILPQSLPFITADTVSALFTYTTKFGCQRDTLSFSHDGAHDVNYWNWIFNTGTPVTTRTHTIIFPATSTNDIQLIVSNGVCSDTATNTIVLDNEVKAAFTMPDVICPEDQLQVNNISTGQIDAWRWNFDIIASSNLKDPLPFLFPNNNKEAYYTVKLVAFNFTLGCSDSTRKTLTVLDHCFIDVPTAFTPNNDGLNDYFWPHNALKADNYEFKVYNRWGQLVFATTDWRKKWDGRINGAVQTTGVFVWMLSYIHRDTKQPVFRKGTVTLIR